MKNKVVSIKKIQGEDAHSPLAGQQCVTRGVVTMRARRGFFMQTPDAQWDQKSSDGIFVFSTDWRPPAGALIEVKGKVVDYLKTETAKPVTQIFLDQVRIVKTHGPQIEPIEINSDLLPLNNKQLTKRLNSLHGMLLKIPAGQTFIAPSNVHGDYVLCLKDDNSSRRTENGGVLIDPANPLRWYPGFRITNYNKAPRINVGAELLNDVVGALNYRADAFQLSVEQQIKFEQNYIKLNASKLVAKEDAVSIMTLNCFNLDPHIESQDRVMNPQRDVDDDWGDGRFHSLAQAVVLLANSPDIIALQEIQDNDGAEITEVVAADNTYKALIKTIKQLNGIEYEYVNRDPQLGADGGQPGGNIRNGYLYNPQRINLRENSVRVLGQEEDCFISSRKPLLAIFELKSNQAALACINLHLASKRHQQSIFAPVDAGYDVKLAVRVEQAEFIRQSLLELQQQGINYYITGDFNDTEHSQTLRALLGKESVNLLESLPEEERYDYNHRGKLQTLMHGIVAKKQAEKSQYEIIHGNELLGVQPGEESEKASDHAYVLAQLSLKNT